MTAPSSASSASASSSACWPSERHRPIIGALIDKLGRGLDDALADIRSVTRDGAPRTLAGFGVAEALRSVTAGAALPVVIDADGFGRYPPEIERAVYYSCVEALQNSVKHGGSNAVVRIGLRSSPSGISFVVEDSGVGFVAGRARSGAGLQNLADRVGALGGRLTVDLHLGTGTRIRGEIPLRDGQRDHQNAERSRSGVLRRRAFTGGRYRRRSAPGRSRQRVARIG